ncbi:MAG TPA: KUP/HAK/KT family potassium transporter, partial [Polyangiales bacterium]|nr:KUP/HAK/KT family potassium transporter [Polyangiales bacterium]
MSEPEDQPPPPSLAVLSLSALGVVYGDIGTSVLYTVRECFHPVHGVPPTAPNVLGILSLITWSLVLVVSFKYLLVVMRADNDGEGGILALMALVLKQSSGATAGPAGTAPRATGRGLNALILAGLFGASLLYGEGMITPAISVLGAIEGL